MNEYTIELIRDLKQCKKWGFNEPVMLISNPRISTVIPATKISYHTIELAVQRCERRPQFKNTRPEGY